MTYLKSDEIHAVELFYAQIYLERWEIKTRQQIKARITKILEKVGLHKKIPPLVELQVLYSLHNKKKSDYPDLRKIDPEAESGVVQNAHRMYQAYKLGKNVEP